VGGAEDQRPACGLNTKASPFHHRVSRRPISYGGIFLLENDTVTKTLYQAFGTEKQYETEGVTLDFGVAKFRIRRAGGSNRRFLAALSSKLRPHRRALEAGTMSDETAEDMHKEVYFETVVVDWENVTDREGNQLPYTLENFKKVMRDLPDLWNTLRVEADNMKNFQIAEAEADGVKLGE
jgi:hypothetical protein